MSNIKVPGEFEQVSQVWMFWPTLPDYVQGKYVKDTQSKMIKALVNHVPVRLLVPEGKIEEVKNRLCRVDLSRVKIYDDIPYVDSWPQDMGPSYVLDDGMLKMLDFSFNGWGNVDAYTQEDIDINTNVDRVIATRQNIPCITSDLITEGGNRNHNGKGVMLTVNKTNLRRNPSWSEETIAQEFKRTMGVGKIIDLKSSVDDYDPYRGPVPIDICNSSDKAYFIGVEHVDEVARFADERTIILSSVQLDKESTYLEMINWKRMEQNYITLRHARDLNDKPFKIIRMPVPKLVSITINPGDGMYDWLSFVQYINNHQFPVDGSPVKIFVSGGYTNFVVANDVVLIAKYWKPGMPQSIADTDGLAVKAINDAFPGRKVVGIDAEAIHVGGGGMHCVTATKPAINNA